MVARPVPRFLTPGPDTLLGRWLGRQVRHPDEFGCAVRVRAGTVSGEGRSWAYRRSAVDPVAPPGLVLLRHGEVALTLRFTGDRMPARGLRPHHVAWAAVEEGTGALVEVGGDVELGTTFGLDG